MKIAAFQVWKDEQAPSFFFSAHSAWCPFKKSGNATIELKRPELSNPEWKKEGSEITEALVDDEVVLSVEVKDIDDGEMVGIEIWENDENNDHDFVTNVTGTVHGGKIEVPWKVKYTADNDDSTSGKELAEKGYTLPEYHFVVNYKRAESVKSEVMEVKEWIKVLVTNEETDEIAANLKCILLLADNTEQEVTTDTDGYLYLDYLPFGKMYIRVYDDYTE